MNWSDTVLQIEIEYWQIQIQKLRCDHLVNAIVTSMESCNAPTILAILCIYRAQSFDFRELTDEIARIVMPGVNYRKYQTVEMMHPRVLLNEPNRELLVPFFGGPWENQ